MNSTPPPKWVIIETTVENGSIRKCHHRVKMFVANVIHEQSTGLIDLKTSEVYSHAFNNKWFGTEEIANKYIAKYLKDELIAMKEMIQMIETFTNKNPELMI
ncbi:MAG: hypothetical protein DRH57_01550 [Candidatus Cloacimonadota bacterium]|nr:MAG: hypothetical protein DRH57_01550 [Candidatus Cloacimonadota bacterium]